MSYSYNPFGDDGPPPFFEPLFFGYLQNDGSFICRCFSGEKWQAFPKQKQLKGFKYFLN